MGKAQRAGFHSPSPGPVWGWTLTFPGAPMASVLSTRNPAASPSPTAASTAAPTTPPLLSAHPTAAGQPAHARTPPARPLSQQKPFPPGPQCACDSASGWAPWGGVFFFPPESPHLTAPPPWHSDRRRPRSHSVVHFDPPRHLPSIPHFCTMLLSPGLPLPPKLLQRGLESTMPCFPSVTPWSQIQWFLAGSLAATRETEMVRGCQFPLCSPPLAISMAPGQAGNICFPSYSSCSLYTVA